MSLFKKALGKVGGFISNPIGSITGALGMKNQYQAQGANITNPFGSDAAAQAAIQNAMGTSGNIFGQQGGLAQALQARMLQSDPRYNALIQQTMDQAAGRGPNPAQAQFQQNMNQAVQQQAGTIASVRGLNPAMAAKLAATGGAGMMQGAAGQEAVTQAQQQLGAQGLAGQLLGQQGGLQAQYGGLAAGMLGTMGAQGMTQQQILQAAVANQNAQRVAMQENINNVNAGVAAQNAQTNAGFVGGLLQGAGQAASMAGMAAAKGGKITRHGVQRPQRLASGGPVKMAAGGPLPPAELPSMDALGPTDVSQLPPPLAMAPMPSYQPASLMDAPGGAAAKGAGPSKPASSLGQALIQAGQEGQAQFRQFAGAPAYAPWVMTPGQFADGGKVPPTHWNARSKMMAAMSREPEPAPTMVASHDPNRPAERLPPPSPEMAQQGMAIAHTVARSLSELDPRAAAVVFADLTGIPTSYTPDDVRNAYHTLALHNASLLARRGEPPPPPAEVPGEPPAPAHMTRPVAWNPRSRMMAAMSQGAPPPVELAEEDSVPLKRAMGGRTFARDGRVPGHAEVEGDDERNDKVPAMLSPGEIVIPRSAATGPDAPRKAANFVSHLVSRRRFSFGGIVDAKRR